MRNKSGPAISVVLNMAMAVMYATGGVVLFFWNMPSLPALNRRIISAALIAYAAYRAYKVMRRIKKPVNEN